MQLKTFAFHIDENDGIDTDLNTMLCSHIDNLILNGWKMILSLIVYDKGFSELVDAKRYRKTLMFAKKEIVNA